MAQGNQIRLVNHAFKCEAIYFLKGAGPDSDEIANRLLKHNTTVHTDDPETFMKSIIKEPAAAPAKGHWNYHGEIRDRSWKSPLSAGITDFCRTIEKGLPKDYEFHEIGICVAGKADKKGKFGNIEVKYRPKGAAVVPGINPDRMISINLHIDPRPSKSASVSLKTDTLIKQAKAFLEKASDLFKNADLDDNFKAKGFALADHPLTVENLEKYRANVEAKNLQGRAVSPGPFHHQAGMPPAVPTPAFVP